MINLNRKLSTIVQKLYLFSNVYVKNFKLFNNFFYLNILVFIGSFILPVCKAFFTSLSSVIPHNSNKVLPPLILTAQWETLPLPLPILDSVAFAVIGKSGKTRIHSFPFLLIFLIIACLHASI